MIEFRNVTKSYGDNAGLTDVNIRIKAGEFVFLVGPSGAGKSTFIKLILKEINPESGHVYFEGRDITQLPNRLIPALRRSIGVVFQDFRLLSRKTVYENVAFAMEAVHQRKRLIIKQVPHILKLVGISDQADRYPHELSGGEAQRVAIARAIVNNPKILIADEPTGNLDPEKSWEIVNLLEQINLRGTTVVMVTHDKSIVDQMGKRVIQLDHGCVVRDDSEGFYVSDEDYAEEVMAASPEVRNAMLKNRTVDLSKLYSVHENDAPPVWETPEAFEKRRKMRKAAKTEKGREAGPSEKDENEALNEISTVSEASESSGASMKAERNGKSAESEKSAKTWLAERLGRLGQMREALKTGQAAKKTAAGQADEIEKSGASDGDAKEEAMADYIQQHERSEPERFVEDILTDLPLDMEEVVLNTAEPVEETDVQPETPARAQKSEKAHGSKNGAKNAGTRSESVFEDIDEQRQGAEKGAAPEDRKSAKGTKQHASKSVKGAKVREKEGTKDSETQGKKAVESAGVREKGFAENAEVRDKKSANDPKIENKESAKNTARKMKPAQGQEAEAKNQEMQERAESQKQTSQSDAGSQKRKKNIKIRKKGAGNFD